MKNFSLVLVGLAILTVVIIAVAMSMNQLSSRPEDPGVQAAVEERIAPVGKVFAGEEGRAEQAAALAAQAAATPAAFDGSLDGEMIYTNVCAACHAAGVAGAPAMQASAWEGRMDQGMDVMVAHAIEGYTGSAGYMPPKGGRTDLSDEQVRATVEWMLSSLN